MTDKLIQENGFRCLLDAAPDPLVVVDRRGDVVAANREAEQRFGWAEADLVGHPIDQLIPPRFQRVHLVQRASQAVSPAIPPSEAPVSHFVRRRDGTEFPVEISQKRLGAGKDALILVTIRDLTEWRRAHESLFQEKEQAVATLESIGDAVLTTDAAGMITYMNPVAERLTGWRVVEALGQPVDTVMTLISDAARLPADSTAARCLREGRTVTLGDGVLLLAPRWHGSGDRGFGSPDPRPERGHDRRRVGVPRRDRAAPGGPQALPRGHPRRPDGPGQPGRVRAAPDAGRGRCRRRRRCRRVACALVPGPGRVQAHQRHQRPRRRGRAAPPDQRPADRPDAPARHAGTPGW